MNLNTVLIIILIPVVLIIFRVLFPDEMQSVWLEIKKVLGWNKKKKVTSTAKEDLKMPKTETPFGVYVWLVILIFVLGFVLYMLFDEIGLILLLVVLGVGVKVYTVSAPGFHAKRMLNHFTKTQRVVFQGLSAKLPWETEQDPMIDLRVDLKDVCNDTYPSLDSMMEIKYVYTLRPDFSGENPGEKIILYSTYEEDVIKQSFRALISMSLSDYYGKNEGKNLLDKAKINKEVLEADLEGLIEKFEEDHAVKTHVRLEDSDFDKKTQKFRDTISAAKSFNEAVQALMTEENVKKGMTLEQATRIIKLANLENVKEELFDVKIDASGLENLRDVTFLGKPSTGGGKK